MDSFEKVEKFNTTFGHTVRSSFETGTADFDMRRGLVSEEALETRESLMYDNRVETADGLADTLFTVLGFAQCIGITNKDLKSYEHSLKAIVQSSLGKLRGASEEDRKEFYTLAISDVIEDTENLDKKTLEFQDAMVYILTVMGCVEVISKSFLGVSSHELMDIVYRSNMSKLDEDGQPIYREDGKILKGKGYWAPTDELRKVVEGNED